MNAPDDEPTGLARMMDLSSSMLLDVCEAIAATPEDQQRRFEMLQLKATTALALATLAQTTVAMLDVDDDEEDEDAVDLAQALHELDNGRLAPGGVCCGMATHAGEPNACKRWENHDGMHARRENGAVVRW